MSLLANNGCNANQTVLRHKNATETNSDAADMMRKVLHFNLDRHLGFCRPISGVNDCHVVQSALAAERFFFALKETVHKGANALADCLFPPISTAYFWTGQNHLRFVALPVQNQTATEVLVINAAFGSRDDE